MNAATVRREHSDFGFASPSGQPLSPDGLPVSADWEVPPESPLGNPRFGTFSAGDDDEGLDLGEGLESSTPRGGGRQSQQRPRVRTWREGCWGLGAPTAASAFAQPSAESLADTEALLRHHARTTGAPLEQQQAVVVSAGSWAAWGHMPVNSESGATPGATPTSAVGAAVDDMGWLGAWLTACASMASGCVNARVRQHGTDRGDDQLDSYLTQPDEELVGSVPDWCDDRVGAGAAARPRAAGAEGGAVQQPPPFELAGAAAAAGLRRRVMTTTTSTPAASGEDDDVGAGGAWSTLLL